MGMGMGMQQPMYHQPPPMFQTPPPQPNLMHPAPQKAVPKPPTEQLAQPVQQQQPQQAPVDPAARPQDELARTAQALVEQLDKEELGTNQKLADSQFVRLLRGLGDGSVVVKEGSGAVQEGTEVSEGAMFVDSSGGGDWASAFLGSDAAPQQAREAPAADAQAQFQVHTDPRAAMQKSIADFQTALTMNEGMGASARRKSVHFDEPAVVSGVPSTLEEAQQHVTSQPAATTSWEEDLTDDFNDEAFLHYNGMPQMAQTTGPTNAEREGWDQIQDDWYTTESVAQPYMFHQANPYALGSPIVRELSPTTMVSPSSVGDDAAGRLVDWTRG